MDSSAYALKEIVDVQEFLKEIDEDNLSLNLYTLLKSDYSTNPRKLKDLIHEIVYYPSFFDLYKTELIDLIGYFACSQADQNCLSMSKTFLIQEIFRDENDQFIMLSKIKQLLYAFHQKIYDIDEICSLFDMMDSFHISNNSKFLFFTAFEQHLELFDKEKCQSLRKSMFFCESIAPSLKKLRTILESMEKNRFKYIESIWKLGYEQNTIQFALAIDDTNLLRELIKTKRIQTNQKIWITPLEIGEDAPHSLINVAGFHRSYNCFNYLYRFVEDSAISYPLVFKGGSIPILRIILNNKETDKLMQEAYQLIQFHNEEAWNFLVSEYAISDSVLVLCFFESCKYSFLPTIEYYINKGLDINVRNQYSGMGAIDYIIQYSHYGLLKYFLTFSKFNINIFSSDGEHIIFRLFKSQKHRAIQLMLEREDFDLNMKNKDGLSLLMLACEINNLIVANYLLNDPRTDINAKANGGETALSIAVKSESSDIVESILRRPDLDPNTKNEMGESPLFFALKAGNSPLVKLILQHQNSDPNIKLPDGWTPLTLSIMLSIEEVFKQLVDHPKIDLNLKGKDGNSPILCCCAKQQDDFLSVLLSKPGININSRGNAEESPLYLASLIGNTKIVELLMKNPTLNVNLRNNDLETPLHAAAKKQHHNVIKLLISHKDINVNAMNQNGITPLNIAIQNDDIHSVNALLSSPHINPNLSTENVESPLFLACSKNYLSIVDALLKHPLIDVNCPSPPNSMTPLFHACKSGKYQLVNILLASKKFESIYPPGSKLPWLFEAANDYDSVIVSLLKFGFQPK